MKEICPIWEKLLLETIKVNQVVQKQIIAKRKEKQMAEFFRRVEKKYILTKNQYLEINASDGSSTEGMMGQNVNSNVGIIINGEETASITVTGTVTANGSNQKNGNQMNYRNTKNFH